MGLQQDISVNGGRTSHQDKESCIADSPRCDPSSTLDRLHRSTVTEQERRRIVSYGRKQSSCAMQLCRVQHSLGLPYLCEHPRYADSWKEHAVMSTMKSTSGYNVEADLCRFRIELKDSQGRARFKKPTGFMTNTG